MNKFIIGLALVAVAIGVVAANKHPRRRQPHFDDSFEFESNEFGHQGGCEHERCGGFGGEGKHGLRHGLKHHGHHGHHGQQGHLGQHGHLGGFEHSGGFEHNGGFQGNQGFHGHQGNHGIRRPFRNHRGKHGRPGFAGQIHGAGGLREHENHAGGVESNTHLGDHKSIEGKKGFIGGEKSHVDNDVDHHSENDNSGIHKHQVVNSDKTIVKDKTNAVNDVDGFRNSNEQSDSAHFSAGEDKFAAGGASGKVVKDKEFDQGQKAGFADDQSFEAGGAFGASGSTF